MENLNADFLSLRMETLPHENAENAAFSENVGSKNEENADDWPYDDWPQVQSIAKIPFIW